MRQIYAKEIATLSHRDKITFKEAYEKWALLYRQKQNLIWDFNDIKRNLVEEETSEDEIKLKCIEGNLYLSNVTRTYWKAE